MTTHPNTSEHERLAAARRAYALAVTPEQFERAGRELAEAIAEANAEAVAASAPADPDPWSNARGQLEGAKAMLAFDAAVPTIAERLQVERLGVRRDAEASTPGFSIRVASREGTRDAIEYAEQLRHAETQAREHRATRGPSLRLDGASPEGSPSC